MEQFNFNILSFNTHSDKKKMAYKDYYQFKLLKQYSDIHLYKKQLSCILNFKNKQNDITLNSLFDKSDFKSIKKKYGKALYQVEHDHDKHLIKILFYKRIISDQKVKLEFHFCDDKLFYYNYTFPYLGEQEKNELIHSLCKKYNLESAHLYDECIIDSNQIAIRIKDQLDLTFKYLDTKSDFIDYIEKYNYKKSNKHSTKKSKSYFNLNNLF